MPHLLTKLPFLQPHHFIGYVFSIFLFCVSAVHATNYYVDFSAGNDTNPGTSISAPWKTLPGTRIASGTAWKSARWGAFDQNHKIPPGTTIYLKSGTRLSNSVGGYVLIDSTYYQHGTSSAPITIQRLSSWGIGNVIFDGSGMTIPGWTGILNVNRIKYVIIDGSSPSGIVVSNSKWNCIRCTDSGVNGLVLRNLELSVAPHALLAVFSSDPSSRTYMSGVTLDAIIAHDGKGATDGDSLIYMDFVENFTVRNCTGYASGKGSDIIHLDSCRNGWVMNCTVSGGGEQGIDLSRNGTYKMRDDSYNITVRDCVSHDNAVNNFDQNSGTHHVYWLNCFAWRTTSKKLGDACFNVHEGTAGPNWWINCSSSQSSDRGFSFGWGGNPWKIPSGTYNQYLINCVSSADSVLGSASCSGSVWVDKDHSSGSGTAVAAAFQFLNCNFHTTSPVHGTVEYKGKVFHKSDILLKTGGWFGNGCLAVNPSWKGSGSTWTKEAQQVTLSSPLLNTGKFIFTTSVAVSGGTVMKLKPLVGGMDVTRVFRAGDWITLEGSGSAEVQSVISPDTIVFRSMMTTLTLNPLVNGSDISKGFRVGDWITIDGANSGVVASVQAPRTVVFGTAGLSWQANKGVWFKDKSPPQIGAD